MILITPDPTGRYHTQHQENYEKFYKKLFSVEMSVVHHESIGSPVHSFWLLL